MRAKRTEVRRDLNARPGALAEMIRAVEHQLVGAALSAGLHLERPRSVPDRIVFEARRFLALLGVALISDGERELELAVVDEVRGGAFACSDLDEALAVVAVWRNVLRSFADGHDGVVRSAELERAIDRIASALIAGLPRLSAERTDIVVIGGSAGGLAALTAMLAVLDARLAATLVVVLHTHAKSPMMMPLVLSRITTLAISYPADGGLLHLGHVYIAAPGRHLGLVDGKLSLITTPRVRYSRPSVDVLFQTAAASFGTRVASVILSGTGRDGSDGTLAVRDAGGATFAQSADDAQFAGMPEAAIATGAVQHVAPLAELRGTLVRLIHGGADLSPALAP